MMSITSEFEQLLGRAALEAWPDLPRDAQERLFEYAVGADEGLRQRLAVYLHENHPRTVHPEKPAA
jgi:hypothetical protein